MKILTDKPDPIALEEMLNEWANDIVGLPTCSCCECQGKMCLVWHPGHSHKTHDWGLSLPEKKDAKDD